MPRRTRCAPTTSQNPVGLIGLFIVLAVGAWSVTRSVAQSPPENSRVASANYKLAYKYSAEQLRPFVYSTKVTPNWIGKTENFWYEFTTSAGKRWYIVDPRAGTKNALFNHSKMAALLSEQVKRPLEAQRLPLARVAINDENTKLKFVAEQYEYEYDIRAETLAKLGKASPAPINPGKMTPEQAERLKSVIGEERFREFLERQKETDEKREKKEDDSLEVESFSADELQIIDEILAQNDDGPQGKGKGLGKFPPFAKGDFRVMAPDKKNFVYSLNHALYISTGDKTGEDVKLSSDGDEDYTFAAFAGFGGTRGVKDEKDAKEKKDRKVRAQATWSKDSRAFYATRTDVRGVKELFLVNSIATPRPTLMKYKYAMPGEANVRKSELFVYNVASKKLLPIDRKWKDEWYTDIHWGKSGDELRFVRNDRLRRNAELCSINTRTGEAKCLILEGFENANLATQPARYLEETGEMLWWSEKASWGHFYLHDRNGKLKNPVTSGDFRAGLIVALDVKNRLLYFRGNAREPGENVYHNHLYSVNLDGANLTLLDPGPGNHDSVLSPSRQFVIDNCSGFDQAPTSVLRDCRGKKIMDLEACDLSKLIETGWKMPEVFTVKAADGVTDLHGHLWKPFDFDAKKRYPVIAHVYPGPQTESMTHSFQPVTGQQQLAQLGFIVIQVGNRGGTPLRSKAYQSFSYWNMRDYGLADKKTAIEQLASRHPWVDIERVGIYGHSGGGFMSAAAMLVKPYNEFFKAAVASAGNHDNNVYNNSWAERYHGLKEVPVDAVKKEEATTPTRKGFKGSRTPDGDVDDDDDSVKEEKKNVAKKDAAKDAKSKDAKVTENVTKDDKAKNDKTKAKDEKTLAKDDKAKDGKSKEQTAKVDEKKKDEAKDTRFEILVPTNAELAGNLKGRLMLVHGDMDNNVHPAGTIRLADALIKANKRFDLMILPGKAHGFADYQPYFTQRMWEFFAEHLLDDRTRGADLYDRK